MSLIFHTLVEAPTSCSSRREEALTAQPPSQQRKLEPPHPAGRDCYDEREIFRLNLRKAMRTAFQRQAINFPVRASRPKRARAMFAGSGTAVKSSSQVA